MDEVQDVVYVIDIQYVQDFLNVVQKSLLSHSPYFQGDVAYNKMILVKKSEMLQNSKLIVTKVTENFQHLF